NALSCNLKAVFSTSQIILVLPWNRPSIAAEGPEYSVPAIGWQAKKFLLLECSSTVLQTKDFVEPASITTASSFTASKILGNCSTKTSTGMETITISAFAKSE